MARLPITVFPRLFATIRSSISQAVAGAGLLPVTRGASGRVAECECGRVVAFIAQPFYPSYSRVCYSQLWHSRDRGGSGLTYLDKEHFNIFILSQPGPGPAYVLIWHQQPEGEDSCNAKIACRKINSPPSSLGKLFFCGGRFGGCVSSC